MVFIKVHPDTQERFCAEIKILKKTNKYLSTHFDCYKKNFQAIIIFFFFTYFHKNTNILI